MSSATCPRLFEVEAMRDGRLAGAELASFERHIASCAACSREVRELEALAEGLRAESEYRPDELHVRRERTRLLSAFNRVLVAPEVARRPRFLLLLPAATALVAMAFVFSRPRAPEHGVRAPATVVRADPAAVWSERAEGSGKKLFLERGVLWIQVDHAPGAGRLSVVLPDGELTDNGTTFTVSVENGRTTRVAVEDGSVVLRIRGEPPVTIGQGESWIPTVRAAAPAISSAVVSEPRSLPVASARPPSSPAPSASAPGPDPSSDFRAAMSALGSGSHREAAAAFERFLTTHPRDPRAEDAAYLRIIALQRSGDSGAMKDAALAYLRRYPKGFRHAEAETLSR